MKRLLFWFTSFALIIIFFTPFAGKVNAAEATIILGDFILSSEQGLIIGTDYSYTDNVLTILSDRAITIANVNPAVATTDTIVVDNGINADITLAGVNIDVSEKPYVCAFKIFDGSMGNVTITLKDSTGNILKSGYNCAGLQKQGSMQNLGKCKGQFQGKLTIQGTGELTATGCGSGAGIGGSNIIGDGNNITINSGKITAISNCLYSAAIGGSIWGGCRNLVLNGGTITAINNYDGPGIGGGGMGLSNNDAIIITDASVKASSISTSNIINDRGMLLYLTTLDIDSTFETANINLDGRKSTYFSHPDDTKLYFYLSDRYDHRASYNDLYDINYRSYTADVTANHNNFFVTPLLSPTRVLWDREVPTKATWDPVPYALCYLVELSEPDDNGVLGKYVRKPIKTYRTEYDFADLLVDNCSYIFRVTAISSQEKYLNSRSVWSNVYIKCQNIDTSSVSITPNNSLPESIFPVTITPNYSLPDLTSIPKNILQDTID